MPLLASESFPLGAKDMLYPACAYGVMHYVSGTCPVKEEDVIRLERNDARITRSMCNITPQDMISAEELTIRQKLKSMREFLQDRRLQRFGHLKRMEESAQSSTCRTCKVAVVWNEVKHGMR